MSDRKEIELGNICTKVLTGGTPLSKKDEYYSNGKIPWLKTKEVNFNRITETEFHISELGLKNSSAKLVPKNSIVIAMYGQGSTAGRVAINKIPLTTNQACCNLIIDEEKANYEFVYYYLSNSYEELVQRKTGSAQPNLNTKLIKSFEINIPSLQEQKNIASILSSLDNKIDLLHRQNKTLEEMAEVLFRQWFVEEVREDWEEGVLGNILTLKRGYDLSKPNRREGKFPIYAASGFSGTHNEFKVKGPGVTTGRSGVLGKVFFIEQDFWPLNTSLYVKDFKLGTPIFSYYLLKTIDIQTFNAGSAVPTLNRNHIHEHPVYLPSKKRIIEFENRVICFFKKIDSNKNKIITLENLRDTLLPKLMSGEVRVVV